MILSRKLAVTATALRRAAALRRPLPCHMVFSLAEDLEEAACDALLIETKASDTDAQAMHKQVISTSRRSASA